MYVFKWLYTIRCLGFQLLGGCIKRAKPFPSPLVFLEFFCMRVASIVYLDFLDAHGGYYMATAYIHLHSFFAIQFNSRKTPFSMLHVKSHRFLLLVSSWVIVVVVCYCWCYVAGVGGCWCCSYSKELTFVLEGACVLHSCQPTKWRSLNRFQRFSLPFSFCFSLFLSWSCRVLAKAATRCQPLLQVTALPA